MNESKRGILLQELSWDEAQAYAERQAVVVLPAGAIEQHGPHLPVETDSRLVWEIARRAVERASEEVDILLAPLLAFGYSTHHRAFPGTMTLRGQTYATVVTELVESLYRTKFRKVLILNGHGGNADPLHLAARMLRDRYEDILVGVANYWKVAGSVISRLRESPVGGMSHACELETSLMWYLCPALVKADRLEKRIPIWKSPLVQGDLLNAATIKVAYHFSDVSPQGVQGDPTLASRAKGEQFFNGIVEEIARMLVDFSALELNSLTRSGAA